MGRCIFVLLGAASGSLAGLCAIQGPCLISNQLTSEKFDQLCMCGPAASSTAAGLKALINQARQWLALLRYLLDQLPTQLPSSGLGSCAVSAVTMLCRDARTGRLALSPLVCCGLRHVGLPCLSFIFTNKFPPDALNSADLALQKPA